MKSKIALLLLLIGASLAVWGFGRPARGSGRYEVTCVVMPETAETVVRLRYGRVHDASLVTNASEALGWAEFDFVPTPSKREFTVAVRTSMERNWFGERQWREDNFLYVVLIKRNGSRELRVVELPTSDSDRRLVLR